MAATSSSGSDCIPNTGTNIWFGACEGQGQEQGQAGVGTSLVVERHRASKLCKTDVSSKPVPHILIVVELGPTPVDQLETMPHQVVRPSLHLPGRSIISRLTSREHIPKIEMLKSHAFEARSNRYANE